MTTIDIAQAAKTAMDELGKTDKAVGLITGIFGDKATFHVHPESGALMAELDWSVMQGMTRAIFTGSKLMGGLLLLSTRKIIPRACPRTLMVGYILPRVAQKLKEQGFQIPGDVILLKSSRVDAVETLLPNTHQNDGKGDIRSTGTQSAFNAEAYAAEQRQQVR